MEDCHKSVGHLGKATMLSKLRERFWIVGAGHLAKSITTKCVVCRKYQAKRCEQKMADLPEYRVTPDEPPFTSVGLDFFGPFEVTRGRTSVKRYAVIFTCLSIRVVHLEMAFSLDTTSCINAIRRFIARRGPVKLFVSDNGTNFQAAHKEFQKEIENVDFDKVQEAHQIEWQFNPPSGSHFGGVWERLIRNARKVMYSLRKENTFRLDDEGLQTLLCEVEAILNGRPITQVSEDHDDPEPLTPNHLLLLRSGEKRCSDNFDPLDAYARRRWRHIQYLANTFWKRWLKEYLPILQKRQKWLQPKRNVQVGDVVTLVENTPRNAWSMGKVLSVHHHNKGLVRKVMVRTRGLTLQRPVDKLILLLEADPSEESPTGSHLVTFTTSDDRRYDQTL